ncbi:sodium:proton antiporter [Halarcobacter mediterraneus]|uniref:Sodium:proton antiporter n=1 Tax=Halarcobacter mediterraneus TaxID=2023153 RepID=A0A4Q1AXK2_9BACT|nr:sodium:proton antiporter NhaD [Halarcobacter mediterraneus]RXK14063.1 sodium:proton antiporter [Halarcobacter mediterraneus]|eukprot:gnl/Chilomastix_cuspidata/7636.p1 GENE.gnl/Chilomastix_cuspidata/7636~~gnl/Chilomastix_cuspidata/7636.p1  ORF type:complete len:465 (-),score=-39.82 gnl/Chilomastix_cuspidata/7636:125-1519(-)
MLKLLMVLLLSSITLLASGGNSTPGEIAPDLTMTWVGFACLFIFVVGYYFVAAEEKYGIDKAKPALFIGTFMFVLVALYYALNDLSMDLVHTQAQHLILEIAEIFFFLFVAMTYIESLIHMGVFDRLKYNLVSKGFSYKKMFWVTGFIAFFLSPIADNLTTALILSTVLITIEKTRKDFLVPGAINIVVAANAGGAWSPFGDITTLMAWTAGKGHFTDFLFLFPASVLGYLVTAFLLSKFVPDDKPTFDASKESKPEMAEGAKVVMGLGVFTIFCAVMSHQVLHLPAMWGMMFGLSLLKVYSYGLQRKYGTEHFNIFHSMAKIENNTLMFFFGILAAVGALYFIGWLGLAAIVYQPDVLGPTWSNIGVGFLSAIVDNVPVMSAVLKANPDMGLDQWMLVTLTAGVGGSMISFGSAAGVGVMGKLHGIYTFGAHMKLAWTIVIGYFVSIAVWYFQYEILGFYHIG